MELITSKELDLVTDYIFAYNESDIDKMLEPLHDEVVFKNISNGTVNLVTSGKEEFRRQAEQAKQYFSHREQRITNLKAEGNQIIVAINYRGIAAIELPNGLKPGDTLRLQGKSVFSFENGKIISIEDIS